MNSEEHYFQHFKESLKRYSEAELEKMVPMIEGKRPKDFDLRYSFEVNLLYTSITVRETLLSPTWQKEKFLPLIVGTICRNWRLLSSPRGIPASYEYSSLTVS